MESLVSRFVFVEMRPIRNRPGAVWQRAKVVSESKTGFQLEWKASAFVGDKLVMRSYEQSVSKDSITRLRVYRE